MSCNKPPEPYSYKDVLKIIREGEYDPIDKRYDVTSKERDIDKTKVK